MNSMSLFRQYCGVVLVLLSASVNITQAAPSDPGSSGPTNEVPPIALRDLSGEYVFLSSFCYPGPVDQKKPRSIVVLDFMATDCKPCIEKLPTFLRVVGEYTNKTVRPFLVATDPFSKQDEVHALVKEMGVKCGVLLDPYQVASQKLGVAKAGVLTIPRTVVISPTGRIVACLSGGEKFESELRAAINSARE